MTSNGKRCATCGGPVRYDEATNAYYHDTGMPQLDTITRDVEDDPNLPPLQGV